MDSMGRPCFEGVASTEGRSGSGYQFDGMPLNLLRDLTLELIKELMRAHEQVRRCRAGQLLLHLHAELTLGSRWRLICPGHSIPARLSSGRKPRYVERRWHLCGKPTIR